jgi:hypothetical protein
MNYMQPSAMREDRQQRAWLDTARPADQRRVRRIERREAWEVLWNRS